MPVTCITPGIRGAIHRFYDTPPFSPSGRYVALTRLPQEDRLPMPGDVADVLLADLDSGTVTTIAQTRGWDAQLGAQVQWGSDDRSLFFNDVDASSWIPHGVRLDPQTGIAQCLAGAIYCLSPDGTHSASPCLRRTWRTRAGYGVVVPREFIPRNQGAPADDGIYLTDTATGESRLLVSLAEIVEHAFPGAERARFDGGRFYAFHVKWNPQGTRLMLVLTWRPQVPGHPWRSSVITLRNDGSDIHCAISDRDWSRGGNHPNWCPDGEHVLMNLNLLGTGMRLVAARHDGTGLHVLSETLAGTGHPTMHPDGKHILTDAYVSETTGYRDGTTPLRWLDIARNIETELVRIRTDAPYVGPKLEMRVDPHPAWDRAFQRVAFNACPDGTRQVFIADMSAITADQAF